LYFSGNGTGEGVVRAVLEAAIVVIVKDERYWRLGLEEGYFSLAQRLESSLSRQVQIKAYATIVMAAIFHGVSPDPISPFLLVSIMKGDDVLEDRDFMAAVASSTTVEFSNWPTDDSPIPAASGNISLLAQLGIEVCDYPTLHNCNSKHSILAPRYH
jgi:hypothetical protein